MPKPLSLILLSFLSAFVFAGCVRTPCFRAGMTFGLIGFTDHESDSIQLIRYEKGTQFSRVIDSNTLFFRFNRQHDTLEAGSGIAITPEFINSDYDYELYFPFASKRIRIDQIQEKFEDVNHPFYANVKIGCQNRIISIRVDGQLQPDTYYSHFYFRR